MMSKEERCILKWLGEKGRGRAKMSCRRQVIKQVEEIGLKKEDAIDRPKWCDAVNNLSDDREVNPATSINGDQTGFQILDLSLVLPGSGCIFAIEFFRHFIIFLEKIDALIRKR